jgi:transcriptional regulator with XRE-family HTH domain
MNQTHLARELGISGQGLWKYENGKTALMASQIAEIANILRVPVATLFGERVPLREVDVDLNADLKELHAAWQRLQSEKLRKATVEFVKQIANELECSAEKA